MMQAPSAEFHKREQKEESSSQGSRNRHAGSANTRQHASRFLLLVVVAAVVLVPSQLLHASWLTSRVTMATPATTAAWMDVSFLLPSPEVSSSVDDEEKEDESQLPPNTTRLGAIVILAPARTRQEFGAPRMCYLLRAVQTANQFVNSYYGPYPLYILVAKDHGLNDEDGSYTERDRNLIRSRAPNTTIIFKEINMYSNDALEPQTTREQIMEWIQQNPSRAFKTLGYRSMCRLWSGRLQQFGWMKRYQYYFRMDDDSLLVAKPEWDPFLYMQEKGLLYYFRRAAVDTHGNAELYEVSLPHLERAVNSTGRQQLPRRYRGRQPYNNFHIASVEFWNSPAWRALFDDMDRNHIFFNDSIGDANVHEMANLMMPRDKVEQDYNFPYRHNVNDMLKTFVTDEFRQECKAALGIEASSE